MTASHNWHGTAQAVTLHDAKGGVVWEGALAPGREVPGLPLAHPFVVGWLDAGLLTPEPTETAEEPVATSRRKRTAAAATDSQEG